MEIIYEVGEVGRTAVPESGGVVSDHLISPGSVIGMLHYRHKLDVSEAQLLDVIRKRLRDLAVAHRVIALLLPGAQMHFIDGYGFIEARRSVAILHPLVIIPVESEIGNNRGETRRCTAS
jgi:hypothetical protein